jgi:hypothetical protein
LATVVGRRRASSVDEKNEEKKTKTANLQEKYLKGDLGEGMGADLNYTIKRLIRGLTSENHATKKGFFMASVQVYARFGNQIDLLNLIKYTLELTKTSSTMKNTE